MVSNLKELLHLTGKGIKRKTTILSTDDAITNTKEFEVSFKSDLWRTSMQSLTATLKGQHDLSEEWVKVEMGIWEDGSISPSEEEITWYDFGEFLVMRDGFTYDDKTKETIIKNAFDKMILTHLEWVPSDIGVTFPATAKEVVEAICDLTGIELGTLSWINDDHVIEESKWHNNRLAYRNALDDIAQMCNSTISIENNKLVIKPINDGVVDTIKEGKKSLDVKAYWGNVNILNLTREPQHDNYSYPSNWTEIPVNDRKELVFANNQIIDKRREELAPLLFNLVQGFGYSPFEYTGFGYLTMKFGDCVNVVDRDNNTHKSYITKGSWKVSTGFSEMLGSDFTNCAKEKYVLLTDQQREGIEIYLMVDQQNVTIQGLITDVSDNKTNIADLTLDIGGLAAKIEGVSFGSILINGSGEENDYSFWTSDITNDPLVPFAGLMARRGMTQFTIWEPIQDSDLLSGSKISFFANGKETNGLWPVVSEYKYSFRARRVTGNQPFTLEIHEFEEDGTFIKKQTRTFDQNRLYEDWEQIQFDEETFRVSLVYIISGVSRVNRLEIAETMFGIGPPKAYTPSLDGLKAWVQGLFTVQSDQIQGLVSEVGIVDDKTVANKGELTLLSTQAVLKVDSNGRLAQVGLSADPSSGSAVKLKADNIAFEGLVTANENFKILLDGSVEMNNALVRGNLAAGTIAGLTFNATQIIFPSSKLKLDSTTNSIIFGTSKLQYYSPSGISNSDGFQLTGNQGLRPMVFDTRVHGGLLYVGEIVGDASRGLILGYDSVKTVIKGDIELDGISIKMYIDGALRTVTRDANGFLKAA